MESKINVKVEYVKTMDITIVKVYIELDGESIEGLDFENGKLSEVENKQFSKKVIKDYMNKLLDR